MCLCGPEFEEKWKVQWWLIGVFRSEVMRVARRTHRSTPSSRWIHTTTETLFSLITAKHCENTHRPSTSVPASFFCPTLQVLAVLGTWGRSKCVTAAKASRWKCRLWQHLLSLRTPWGLEWPQGLKSNKNRGYYDWRIFFSLHQFISFLGIFSAMLLMVDIKQLCDVLLASWQEIYCQVYILTYLTPYVFKF